MIVNCASQWGMTKKNYTQFVQMHAKYAESQGLRIMFFPCNQFNKQVGWWLPWQPSCCHGYFCWCCMVAAFRTSFVKYCMLSFLLLFCYVINHHLLNIAPVCDNQSILSHYIYCEAVFVLPMPSIFFQCWDEPQHFHSDKTPLLVDKDAYMQSVSDDQ